MQEIESENFIWKWWPFCHGRIAKLWAQTGGADRSRISFQCLGMRFVASPIASFFFVNQLVQSKNKTCELHHYWLFVGETQ